MENVAAERALKALSDPTRLRIIQFLSARYSGLAEGLSRADTEGPTAGEVSYHITGEEKISSTVSHHLRILKEAGLIVIVRKGKRMRCNLTPGALDALADHLHLLASFGEAGQEPGFTTTWNAPSVLED